LLVPLDEPEPVLPELLPELPDVLPELPELPEPMLPLLGEVVLLLPLAPVPALEPDLLKCASHSVRDTWPSLLVSTDEKLGAELEAAPEAPELPEAPEAAGDDDDEDDDGLLELPALPDELCASATLDRANSAAAVAALTTLRFSIFDSPSVVGETATCLHASRVPRRAQPAYAAFAGDVRRQSACRHR
jgi:hypothetical protein